jgi:hypothetical protein
MACGLIRLRRWRGRGKREQRGRYARLDMEATTIPRSQFACFVVCCAAWWRHVVCVALVGDLDANRMIPT